MHKRQVVVVFENLEQRVEIVPAGRMHLFAVEESGSVWLIESSICNQVTYGHRSRLLDHESFAIVPGKAAVVKDPDRTSGNGRLVSAQVTACSVLHPQQPHHAERTCA